MRAGPVIVVACSGQRGMVRGMVRGMARDTVRQREQREHVKQNSTVFAVP